MVFARLATPVTGAVVTAAWGTQVKLNFDEALNARAVAQGDLFYAVGGGAFGRLPLGTAGQLLRADNGVPGWSPLAPGDVVASATYPVSVTGAAGQATPTGAASGALAGSYPNPTLGPASVTATQLAANAVQEPAFAAGAVGTPALQDASVTAAKLGTLVVANLPAKPAAVVDKNTSQAVGVGLSAAVLFDGASADFPGGMWNAGQPDRLTVVTTGVYVVDAHVQLLSGPPSGQYAELWVELNGSAMCATTIRGDAPGNCYFAVQVHRRLVAGQSVSVRLVNATTTVLTVTGTSGQSQPSLALTWVSAG